MKVFQIKDPLYGQKIFAIVNCPHEDVEKWASKNYKATLEEEKQASGTYFYLTGEETKDRVFVIWIKSFDWNVWEIGVLAHEVLHLTLGILEHCGLKMSDDSDEAYTYFFEEILCIALRKLRKLYHKDAKIRQGKGLRKKRRVQHGGKKRHPRRKAKVRSRSASRASKGRATLR